MVAGAKRKQLKEARGAVQGSMQDELCGDDVICQKC